MVPSIKFARAPSAFITSIPLAIRDAGRRVYDLVQQALASSSSKKSTETDLLRIPNLKSDSLMITKRLIPSQFAVLQDAMGLEFFVGVLESCIKIQEVWNKTVPSETDSRTTLSRLKECAKPLANASQAVMFTASKVVSLAQSLRLNAPSATPLLNRSVTVLNTGGVSIVAVLVLANTLSSLYELKALVKAHTTENPQTSQIVLKSIEIFFQLMFLTGLAIAIAGMLSTVSAPLASVGTAFLLITGVMTCGKSAIAFIQWMRAEKPEIGKYDKLVHIFNIFMIVVSIAAFVAVSVVSGGVPLYVIAITAFIYSVWLGISGAAIYRIQTLEAQQKQTLI